MIWKKHSLAKKLFLAFMLTSIVTILVIAGLIGQQMRSGFSDYLLQVELQTFDELVDKIAETYTDEAAWQELGRSPRAWHDLVRASVGRQGNPRPPARRPPPPPRQVQPDGAHEPQRRPPPPRPDGAAAPAQPDPLQLGRRLVLLDTDGQRIAGARLGRRSYAARDVHADGSGGKTQVIAQLALISPQAGRAERDNQFLINQFRALSLVSLFAVVLSAIAAYLLARGVVTPIRALVEGARELTAGNYSARLKGEGPDEIGALVEDFNSLAASLEAAEKAERQWMSDASHELKTPLAILKGRIEGLQDGIYQADDCLLDEMHQTVERLNRLVSDLNMLSHAREGRMLVSLGEEDLVEIIQDAVQHISGRYAAKGLVIEMDLPQTLLAPCDRIRIRQMLDNLLENARRYTDSPGRVRVSAGISGRGSDEIRLTIEDSPPQPNPEEIERLFERFYRTDPSRARQSGGSGLGLAVCRAIAEAHKGAIHAAISDLGGLAVHITLPVARPVKPAPQSGRQAGELP